jgi:hypothetical protein
MGVGPDQERAFKTVRDLATKASYVPECCLYFLHRNEPEFSLTDFIAKARGLVNEFHTVPLLRALKDSRFPVFT